VSKILKLAGEFPEIWKREFFEANRDPEANLQGIFGQIMEISAPGREGALRSSKERREPRETAFP
jgi:hypothetical protein